MDTNKGKKGKNSFDLSHLPRPRWNVVDMITYIGRDSVPTYLFVDVDMTWVESIRQKAKAVGSKVTVTAILLKAIAIAQRSHPQTRTAALPWGRTVTFNDIVAGFTVERFVGNQPAVFFGAINNPDTKSVEEIASELKQYSESEMSSIEHLDRQDRFNNMPWLIRRFILWMGLRYPNVRLRCMGATFGLSSIGKWGAKALIPPCVSTSTFGIGEVEQRAVVLDGKIEIRPMMTITLNFDHRIIDGAPAARFMADVKRLLEGGLENYMQIEPTQAALNLEKALTS
jgi:pyruvate/2-oxoglutarate dehydrogenase complex dihydrolipoamide acyltransferase (E2) component